MRGIHTKIVAGAICLIQLLTLTGCTQDAEDVRMAFEDCDQAMLDGDSQRVIELLSPDMLRQFDYLLQDALDATRDEVREKRPSEMAMILIMRNRCTRQQLEEMDGAAWVIYAVEQGWMKSSNDIASLSIGKVTVRGNTAVGEIWVNGEKTKLNYAFVRDGEQWKVDLTEAYKAWDEAVERHARLVKTSVERLLRNSESVQSGKKVPKRIWDPMR